MDNQVNGQVTPTKNGESDIKQHSSKRADTGYRITPFLYEQGFTNGVLKVNTDPFPDYISGNYKKKHASARLNIIDENIKNLEHYITQTISQKIGLEKIISTSKHTIENLERVIAEDTKRKEDILIKIEHYEAEEGKIIPYYSKSISYFFILVGIIFIGAEILITKDVLFDGININPAWKSYSLAIAIALISIAIKPAIDRVFEEPYISGKNRQRMHALLVSVSVLALFALGFLGYFRNLMKTVLYNEINGIEIDISNHPSIAIVLTLTSVLFALSGAICFSIALPIKNSWARKKEIKEMILELTSEFSKVKNDIDEAFQIITDQKIESETASVYLKMLPDTKELEASLELLQMEKSKELALYYEHKEQMEQAWYQTGLQRGKEYQLNGKLLVNPLDVNNIFGPGEASEDENGKIVVMHGQGGKYLHERIRNMIQYNFNRNQKIWNDK